MEINNMKKLDLGEWVNENSKRDWILRSELNVGKGMEKIMVLKREEIKEIIEKMEEFYKKWEGALDGKMEKFICSPMHVNNEHIPMHVGGSRATFYYYPKSYF
jgi:hypothetical protein